jgi:F0F1-type ATP synthase epsilon subunit
MKEITIKSEKQEDDKETIIFINNGFTNIEAYGLLKIYASQMELNLLTEINQTK